MRTKRIPSVELLTDTVEIEDGCVILNGYNRVTDMRKYEVALPNRQEPIDVWITKPAYRSEGWAFAILDVPGKTPVFLGLTAIATRTFDRTSRATVVEWMCRAAGVEL